MLRPPKGGRTRQPTIARSALPPRHSLPTANIAHIYCTMLAQWRRKYMYLGLTSYAYAPPSSSLPYFSSPHLPKLHSPTPVPSHLHPPSSSLPLLSPSRCAKAMKCEDVAEGCSGAKFAPQVEDNRGRDGEHAHADHPAEEEDDE
eukprot:scaffold1438_cov126-Isochrysis_galbana.AAC.9